MSDQQHDLLRYWVANRGAPEDWYGLGCWLQDHRLWVAATAAFAQCVERDPGNFRAMANLGWNAHLSGRSEIGEEWATRAIEAAPAEALPYALRCQIRMALGQDDDAILDGMAGVEFDGSGALNRLSRAFALLNAGQYREGWIDFEARFPYKLPDFMMRPHRLWRGERVAHLLIEAEQGAGDAIFALRWLPQAAALADMVSLYVHTELYALFAEMGNLDPKVRIYPMPRPLAAGDAWCPMMSLPAAIECGTTLRTGAYIGEFKTHAPATPQKARNVGICWAGNPTHDMAHHRDMPLAYMLRLAEVPGVTMHALQVGEGAQQIDDLGAHGVVVDRRPEITNFLDTARIIRAMDLVVSVDTAVAHLAGALGVPCWLIVNQRGRDYRWGSRGAESRWYASQRLFRRKFGEDWGDVVDQVVAELRRIGR
jgi:hypothetical protein